MPPNPVEAAPTGGRPLPAAGGRTGIVAVDVHATDRERVAGQKADLCNTLIRFV